MASSSTPARCGAKPGLATACISTCGSPTLSAPDDARGKLLQSPGIPLSDDGPVFAEPWEAKAFALAVTCHERGLFAWHDWAQALGGTIAARPDMPYYRQWLATLEGLLAEIGTVPEAERLDRVDAWDRAARATPHGEPIVLGRDLEPHD
ncbi:MAG: nitrile hydratase accessory protein [Rhodobiaceae bacterium]|nr:nitrile hydratase accessory protein [Rhodobiaceae bacterium]MCC0040895.1 nitrile hydratase accessory protein [Rhodobiaceae bacterium]